MMWLLLLVLALNGAIATWNAWIVGRMWPMAQGFFMTLLLLCALIQSVAGYSSIALVGLLLGAHGLGKIDDQFLKYAMDLWYLLVIVPVVMSGTVIWLHSVFAAIRSPSAGGILTAGWNTYATYHNVSGMIQHVPDASAGVGKLFGSLGKSKDGAKAMLVLILVGISIGIGFLLTYVVFEWGRSATQNELSSGEWDAVGQEKKPPVHEYR